MELWFSRKHVLWVLINLLWLSGYESCIEEERLGLLSIRDYLESNGVRTEGVLPSWTDNPVSDCCSWERVKCNSTTGRVIELLLNNTSLAPDNFVSDNKIWFLNVSLFLHFEELRNLGLHGNWFTDCYENHGFAKMSSLKMLEVLDLAKNRFQNSILPSLGEIISLRTLNLSWNRFRGSFPAKELKAIEQLEILDLSFNDLSDPPPVEDFKELKNLIALNLRANRFNSNVLPFVSTLTSLKALNLAGNNIEESVSATELASLANLEQLDLSWNNLNGTIILEGLSRLQNLEVLNFEGNLIAKSSLKSLGAITSLKNLCLAWCRLDRVFPTQDLATLKNLEILDLSGNFLNGSLAMLPELAVFQKLQILDLSNNEFSGDIFHSLGHITSLKALSLAGNKLNGPLAQEGLCELTNLQELDLSRNNLSGIIPPCLANLTSLRILDLSSNNLTGTFPNWLLENHTQLEFLSLRTNSSIGPFHLFSNSSLIINKIDILDNHFHGQLQQNVGGIIPNVEICNLSANAFESGIPFSFGSMHYLFCLDLSSNNFSGEVRDTLFTNSSNLNMLLLSDNGFTGQMPKRKSNITSLQSLQLSGNQFTGSLTNFTSHYPSLQFLDISGNFISGKVPDFIGNLSLYQLNMADNATEGTIPVNEIKERAGNVEEADSCLNSYIYVHDLPQRFNDDVIRNCSWLLRPWYDMCPYLENSGLGRQVEDPDRVVLEKSWFQTNQFVLEILFRNRMKNYRCLTNDSSLASAIFVPFYAGLDLGRNLRTHNASTRDALGLDMVKWVAQRPEWKRMWGRDHFFAIGRIASDFRRQSDNDMDWGSKLLNLPEAMNMTILSIESTSWGNEFAVPYPTHFHPSHESEILQWQNRMRTRDRRYLFTFTGAPRPGTIDSIRNEIIDHCLASGSICKLLDCNFPGSKCENPIEVIGVFQDSIFCLQPPGDSPTRRSTFESILAGCIPVFFHPGSAYSQYVWYLPENYSTYSVFIPQNLVKEGQIRINETLLQVSKEEMLAKREEVIRLIPKVIYADFRSKSQTLGDAFDIAVKRVLERVENVRKMTHKRGNDILAS